MSTIYRYRQIDIDIKHEYIYIYMKAAKTAATISACQFLALFSIRRHCTERTVWIRCDVGIPYQDEDEDEDED
jgi:hypothetical protein